MSFLKGLLKKKVELLEAATPKKEELNESASPEEHPFFFATEGGYRLTPDLCISIGPACQPAQYLRAHHLSRHSYPLDWMMVYSLDTAFDLFQNRFDSFFKNVIDSGETVGDMRRVICQKYGIQDIHFFPISQSVEDAKQHYNEMMGKRIDRLFSEIEQYSRILLICSRSNSQLELIGFAERFQSLFPNKNVALLNIRNAPEESTTIRYGSSPHVIFLEEQFVDEHPNGKQRENPDYWLGNVAKWDNIMNRITLLE